MYGAISCRLGILAASFLLPRHIGTKNKSTTNPKITKDITVAIDIPTILLVLKTFFVVLEFDSSVADGPLACFPGVCFVGFCLPGVCPEDGTPENGGDGEDGGVEDVGGGNGATILLNRFPSFLHDRKKKQAS